MRKANTETNRKKATFTLIDVFCVLVAVAILLFIVPNIMQAIPLTPTTGGNVKMSYVITVTDVPEAVMSQIQSDQIIYDIETDEMLGTISSIVHTPYVIIGINQETGASVSNAVNGRYNLNITVTASAEEVDNDYRVNGTTIACGLTYGFRTSSVALTGTCVSLKQQ